ncbi:iron-hydroxamate ABC transporter substrate-binding protein [Paenibacillus sp. FSL R5-0527]|uniref:iron-hydroxamate ABC transporter substrate-binding protein n=1 Tax=Paenibacillus sp. FSL R5-0527 TaxID=2975321 RepID=UPI00097AC721|nr:iron(3+)-hydroxamate-binding protein yxeB [Paenibacillus macerans]
MYKKKKIFSITACAFALTILLTACGGANQAAGNSNAAGQNTGGKAAAETRTYDTVKGPVEIPVKPQRIVTDYYAGELLAVGGNVVGAEPDAFNNPFLKDLLANTEDVGANPVNLEKTLELAPDLIVVMYDKNYDELSKIAPTLYLPYGTTTDIYNTVETFGDIVGEPEKAKAFLADYDQKAAEGREKLKGVVKEDDTFGIYELTNKGELWIFGDNAGRGGQALYNALQLKGPEKWDPKESTFQLSLEALPEYAADYMFLTTYDPDKTGEALDNLKASPVWKNIDAIKNNKVFYNDFDTFYRYDPIAIKEQIGLFVDMIIAGNKGK